MPRTIDEGFKDFLVKLTPSSTESQSAKNHRASIESCLKNNFGLKRFVRIGSFGNGTSISGYSDVDYLACLPTDKLKQNSSSSLVDVRSALDTRFPNTGVRVSCPAVTVPFGQNRSETTEIVPADKVSDYKEIPIYDIPDCSGAWMRACPDLHNGYVRTIDDKFSGKLKALIRFIKAWKYFREVPISSFYLELRITKYATDEKSILYNWDVKRVLNHLWNIQLATMQDPMEISGYIYPCKTDAMKSDALSKLNTAAKRAEKALDAEKEGKISEAFDWWRLLFGDKFPTYYR